jgi:hypothetical protein
MTTAADRHLLFGMLALQNGIISRVQLVAAFQAWTLDKSQGLADYLEARGDLDADDRAAVEAPVVRRLKKHGGDVDKSLAAVWAGKSSRESLARIGDQDLGGTLVQVGSARGPTENDEVFVGIGNHDEALGWIDGASSFAKVIAGPPPPQLLETLAGLLRNRGIALQKLGRPAEAALALRESITTLTCKTDLGSGDL